MLNALLADQGLGDVKLAIAVGAWMAHLGLLAWITGVLVGQLLMIVAVASTRIRRRRAGLPPEYTPLGPSLAAGAVFAVAAREHPVMNSKTSRPANPRRLASASPASAGQAGAAIGSAKAK